MAISKEEFEGRDFYKKKSTKRQHLFLNFLKENKDKAFKTKELAQEIYGVSDERTVMKAYFVLDRLSKKGLVIKKIPYWKIKD